LLSWLAARLAALDRGKIEKLLEAARDLRVSDTQMDEVEKALNYFEVNRERCATPTSGRWAPSSGPAPCRLADKQ
jgi:hypothetical protein